MFSVPGFYKLSYWTSICGEYHLQIKSRYHKMTVSINILCLLLSFSLNIIKTPMRLYYLDDELSYH